MNITIIKCFILISFTFAVTFQDNMNLFVQVVDPSLNADHHSKPIDLCANVKCDNGERCVINENEALCECIEMCEVPNDERQKVCTFQNRTFESDCHFLRQKCWCNKNDMKCVDSSILNDKLDYYGACRNIEKCSLEQMQVFPDRMKVWLDEVLHILNDRKDLDPKFVNLVRLADEMKANHVEKYWTCGVAFEFCELDKSKDHLIQKEELRSLVSSIKSLENCIQPFLEECDLDGNDAISEFEWGKCLDLSNSDMQLLKKYC